MIFAVAAQLTPPGSSGDALSASVELAPPLVSALLASLLSAGLIAMTSSLERMRGLIPRSEFSLQAQHVGRVPRLGGVGLILAFLVGASLDAGDGGWMARVWLVVAAAPILLLALREDIGWHVPATGRLVGTFVAAALYLAITGHTLPRSGIGLVDFFLDEPAFALLLSLLLIAAATQAMNLIDGLHGLCAGIALLMFGAMALIAYQADAPTLAHTALILAVVTLGFLAINYPWGVLFLGDMGAYWLGFAAAALALQLLREVDTLAPAAMLLVFIWPVFDLCLAVLRRVAGETRIFSPDTMHPHHVAVRLLRARARSDRARRSANPRASALILLLAAGPVMLGVLLWDNETAAWFALGASVAAYAWLYLWIIGRARRAQWPWRVRADGPGGARAVRRTVPEQLSGQLATLPGRNTKNSICNSVN